MKPLALTVCLLLGSVAFATDPEREATKIGQSVADALKDFTKADMAFVPAAALKRTESVSALKDALAYPTDEVCIVLLKGAQVKSALERSVGVFPMPNSGFLQLSGLEVTFSKSKAPDERITSISVASGKLELTTVYRVAMPATLARGGLGYFKVWDRNQIQNSPNPIRFEDCVSGAVVSDSSPRWIANP